MDESVNPGKTADRHVLQVVAGRTADFLESVLSYLNVCVDTLVCAIAALYSQTKTLNNRGLALPKTSKRMWKLSLRVLKTHPRLIITLLMCAMGFENAIMVFKYS